MKAFRLWIFLSVLLAPVLAQSQVYQLGELNADQLRAFDRMKTVVLFPGGILEEHGPYMPTYTDGYSNRYYTQQLAKAIAAKPGWKVLIFPEIPLGFGGANNIGSKWNFSGTYTVRLNTLRSVYMDLAGDLGEQKFRWIFIVHDHGDPAHNIALDQASDYFRDNYGGTMVHLFGLAEVQGCYDVVSKILSKKANEEDGFTVHAAAEEQSEVLFLHPELASPAYKTAPSLTAKNFQGMCDLANKTDWPGYFGAPRQATAALGKQVLQSCSQKLDEVTLRVLDGLDSRTLPLSYQKLEPCDAAIDGAEKNHDREIEAKQKEWLKAKGLE
jgi:creatinine amidohydrolase